MTKKHVTISIAKDWQEAFQDKLKGDVLLWIEENVPDGFVFGYDYGYDSSTYGKLEYSRLETDEEESAREAIEAKAAATRLQKENAEILRRASILEMAQMENTVLAEYLVKHKDNPRINDLENLNRALFKMPDTGYNGETIQMVKDCIREIEKGTPDGTD